MKAFLSEELFAMRFPAISKATP
jgi:hypothetical protein